MFIPIRSTTENYNRPYLREFKPAIFGERSLWQRIADFFKGRR